MKDGIIRPGHVVGKPMRHPDSAAYQEATARSIYEYFQRVLDQRTLEPREDLLDCRSRADQMPDAVEVHDS